MAALDDPLTQLIATCAESGVNVAKGGDNVLVIKSVRLDPKLARRVKPDSAMRALLAYAKEHPNLRLEATPTPHGKNAAGWQSISTWLVGHGFRPTEAEQNAGPNQPFFYGAALSVGSEIDA